MCFAELNQNRVVRDFCEAAQKISERLPMREIAIRAAERMREKNLPKQEPSPGIARMSRDGTLARLLNDAYKKTLRNAPNPKG